MNEKIEEMRKQLREMTEYLEREYGPLRACIVTGHLIGAYDRLMDLAAMKREVSRG